MSFALLYNLLPESFCARWWNKQWKRSRVLWDLQGNGQQEVQECLLFDQDDRNAAIGVLLRMGTLPDALDDRVRFIVKRFQDLYDMSVLVKYGGCYDTDSHLHDVLDYWQSPKETVDLGKGDCDDWGLLLYCILRQANVPAWRLKCNVTNVIKQGVLEGLHFDLLYLAKTDYEWYVLEGTWYPQTALLRFLHEPRKECTDLYGAILFTFNEEFVWAQHDFNVKPLFLSLEELS